MNTRYRRYDHRCHRLDSLQLDMAGCRHIEQHHHGQRSTVDPPQDTLQADCTDYDLQTDHLIISIPCTSRPSSRRHRAAETGHHLIAYCSAIYTLHKVVLPYLKCSKPQLIFIVVLSRTFEPFPYFTTTLCNLNFLHIDHFSSDLIFYYKKPLSQWCVLTPELVCASIC